MRTVRLSLKAARTALEALGESSRFGASQALVELRSALSKASRASTTRRTLRKPKEAKHKAKREARQEVRAAVMARAEGACESCGAHRGEAALHFEHQWGRARAESLESCRALCVACHDDKTNSRPSGMAWLKDFYNHAKRYGYSAEVEKTRRRMAFVEARGTP